jgi:hypothetical protein
VEDGTSGGSGGSAYAGWQRTAHGVPERHPQAKDAELCAAVIAHEVAERMAAGIVHATDWLEEQGDPLTQTQKLMLLRAAMLSFSGLETLVGEVLREAASPGHSSALRLVGRPGSGS